MSKPAPAPLQLALRAGCPSVLYAIVAFDEKIRDEVRVVELTTDEEARALNPKTGKLPCLVCPDGVVDTIQGIARHLARVVKGSTTAPKPSDQAQTDQALTTLSTELEPVFRSKKDMTPVLYLLNSSLQSIIYFLSGKLTFVDIFYYAMLQPVLVSLSPAERTPLCNICRYFDNIQHLLFNGVPAVLHEKALLPRVELNCYAPVAWPPRPEFVMPEVAPTPATAAGAAAASAPPGDRKKGKPAVAPAPEGAAPEAAAPPPAERKKGKPADAATPPPAAPAAGAPAAAPAEEKKPKEKKPKEKPAAAAPKEEAVPAEEFGLLDIRVGHVLRVERHPNADSLYVEQVDVGEPTPRTIVSGLVNFVPIDQFQGSKVLVLCNLKPKEMRGVPSAGMVLCGHDEPAKTKVELTRPPDVPAGTRITVEGIAPGEVKILDSKVWPRVQPHFHTDVGFTVTYKGKPLMTPAGPCKVSTLANAAIA